MWGQIKIIITFWNNNSRQNQEGKENQTTSWPRSVIDQIRPKYKLHWSLIYITNNISSWSWRLILFKVIIYYYYYLSSHNFLKTSFGLYKLF